MRPDKAIFLVPRTPAAADILADITSAQWKEYKASGIGGAMIDGFERGRALAEAVSGVHRMPLGAPPQPPQPSSYCRSCGAPRETPTNFGRVFPPCSYCGTPAS